MIQRGKDHSGAGGAQRSTPHMTQPNSGSVERSALTSYNGPRNSSQNGSAPRRGDEAVVGLGAQCLLLALSRR